MTIESGVRRIVVGVDGSAESVAALRWACREASLRAAEIIAVLAQESACHQVASYAVPAPRSTGGSWGAARSIPGTVDPTELKGSAVTDLTCTAAATCVAVGGFGGRVRRVPGDVRYGVVHAVGYMPSFVSGLLYRERPVLHGLHGADIIFKGLRVL